MLSAGRVRWALLQGEAERRKQLQAGLPSSTLPEPVHDSCMGGPKHPLLQEKGALCCTEMEAAVFCPQTGEKQGSWSLQSRKAARAHLRNSHIATQGRGELRGRKPGAGVRGPKRAWQGRMPRYENTVASGMKSRVPQSPSSPEHVTPAERAAAGSMAEFGNSHLSGEEAISSCRGSYRHPARQQHPAPFSCHPASPREPGQGSGN